MRNNEQNNEKKEFDLEQAFVLWKKESKTGLAYLSGFDLHNNKLIGFFNTNKENPKAPDVRVFSLLADGKQDKEVCTLWSNISKGEKSYLTGSTSDNENIVAFFGDEDIKKPYIRAYFKDNK